MHVSATEVEIFGSESKKILEKTAFKDMYLKICIIYYIYTRPLRQKSKTLQGNRIKYLYHP